MIEAVRISETSAYFNETTRRYIPEGCLLHEDITLKQAMATSFLMLTFPQELE
jgi:hypothetical protein